MRGRVISLLTVAASLLGAYSAVAQVPASAKLKMPAWDANFSLGFITNSSRDEGGDNEDASVHADARFDVGHYWTQHLKTEAGVSLLNRWEDYNFESFPVPGLRGGAYSITRRSMRMTVVTPTLTYQFLENQFAHPYVSAAVRVGFLRTDLVRDSQTFTDSGVSYTVSALDRRESSVIARPIAAAGFKSYFNERTFLRTEAQTLFGSDGSAYLSLRAGVGMDF